MKTGRIMWTWRISSLPDLHFYIKKRFVLEKTAITEVTDRNIVQKRHPNLFFILIYYWYFLIVCKFKYLYNCVMMKL